MRRKPSTRGFTLIEVMVAVLLLVIAMTGFVPFFLSGLEKASAARYKSAATNIARQVMEEIRQLDYREIKEDTSNPSDPTNLSNRLGTTATLRGTTFTIAYAVESSLSGGGQLKKVTVTVTWPYPPAVSPAVVTTLIHQQFLGPRGSRLELVKVPGQGDIVADPLGTPFPLLQGHILMKYHVAQADWDLVYSNLNQPGMAKRNVYMRAGFMDDAGAFVPLGSAAADYKIDNTYLTYTTGADGKVNDIFFQYEFDATTIPDGYWDMQAVIFNEYDQPGNLWNLRVRMDSGAPTAPATFTATAQNDTTVDLSWVPGAERDRASWVLGRMKQNSDGSWPADFTTVVTLNGVETTYVDVGTVGTVDPWGDSASGITNTYRYQLYAIDLGGRLGAPATVDVQLPPATTTTTLVSSTTSSTTSTTLASTTTTTALYSVTITNNDTKHHAVVVKNSAGSTVYSTSQLKKGTSVTINNLPADSYNIYLDGNSTPHKSFTLPGTTSVQLF